MEKPKTNWDSCTKALIEAKHPLPKIRRRAMRFNSEFTCVQCRQKRKWGRLTLDNERIVCLPCSRALIQAGLAVYGDA